METYVDTIFKFDAGEIVWLPDDFKFHADYINPNEFTTNYVQTVSGPVLMLQIFIDSLISILKNS